MNRARISPGRLPILFACIIAALVAVFVFAGEAYTDDSTDKQPETTRSDAPQGELDITDTAAVEEMRDRLIQAILDGDGTPIWNELTPQARSVVVDAVMDSITYVPISVVTFSTSAGSD